jgi:1-deoxy-D-xylulose-5-phosphate reductoisomerase
MCEVKTITVLGATGSIGQSALALVRQFPAKYSVHALVAGSNIEKLAALALEFSPRIIGISDHTRLSELRALVADTDIKIFAGESACTEIAAIPVDLVIAGIIGLAGLPFVMAAVEAGQTIGLANKETLVSAGALVIAHAVKSGAHILPLDSEHNAIFQCWDGWKGHKDNDVSNQNIENIRHICLTASGGPFLNLPLKDFKKITPANALKHPNWKMGQKISIDSATMMNKGLEVIEAHWLFALSPEMIKVLVHPQQAIHGLVYFRDGSVVAQLGSADMRTSISYALAWPERLPWENQALDLVSMKKLEFRDIDTKRFPCFVLARQALVDGDVQPAVLNAANEIAVEAFLQRRISFNNIASVVEDCLSADLPGDLSSLAAVLDVDANARRLATVSVAKHQLS